jgi:3-hydroxyacyl-[acyl-carrier-protein] dehydratase
LTQLDIHEVLRYLPHRYPFLLIDRVLDYTKGETLTALKNVTINEPFFPGHFPVRPVMPGVLIVEAMAQACAILLSVSLDATPSPNTVYYFVGIDNMRFKRPVEPGDQLLFKVALKRRVRTIWMFEGTASVGDEVAASGEVMCTVREVE